jgi:hypothetical protein
MLFAASGASADTGDIIEPQDETAEAGFQAGTCFSNQEAEAPKAFCSVDTPGLFYKQAAGHPPVGFTQYIIQHEEITGGPFGTVKPIVEPIADRTIKTLRVDLPPGLTVNPQATPKCSKAAFETVVEPEPGKKLQVPACPKNTVVGHEEVTLVVNTENAVPAGPPGVFLPKGFVIQPDPAKGTLVNVYNLEPEEGEPARFGFVIAFSKVIFLETEVAWENDFHESFTIKLPGPSAPFSTLKSRLVNFGQEAGSVEEAESGDGTYITNPTTCFDPNEAAYERLYSTWFRAESHGEPNPTFPAGSTPFEAKLPEDEGKRIMQEGCAAIPFDPSIEVAPGTTAVDSPAPATVTAKLPFDPAEEGGEGFMQSHVRRAEVTLPKGMGLNPSGANGLVACTDAMFKKGQRIEANECPLASDIGTVEVESPPLAEPLIGDVYVGEQKSTNPESGELFRILVEAKSLKEGIVARLVGNVKANKTTGQLTAVFDEQEVGEFVGSLPKGLPQVPFESLKLKFDGSKAVLTSPPTCSSSDTSGQMEPWARPGTTTPVSSKFTLSSDPGGGSCPQTLAQRKFAPPYTAKTDSTKAGAYSPFRVHIGRPDGQQELKVVNVTLPKGLTGKLVGIPYCSDAALAAAVGTTGKSQTATPSCSSASQIGTATVEAGTGSAPFKLNTGKAYLAGPYKGAPLSMAVITPALAGPYDLGTVVVRVALNVDPKTAQINAVSDLIPDVFGGVKLDIRSIDVNVDRSQFMLNPTNCAAQGTSGVINGGGGDPANPAAFSTYAVNAPFQASGCSSLGFKPKLFTKLFGPTQRAKNPRIRAILEARKGDANITRTALTLPHSLFLDQSHIGTVCTRPQLASHTCPKASVYGNAEAKTPLLDEKLKGKVYLVSSEHQLPDLVADLRGQVNIQLYGVISSKRGGLKTVFNNLPDVPVTKFILNMQGGKKSLLVNSTNICKNREPAVLNIKGQNGKKVKSNKYRLNISSCGKKK